jgi:hypothetical protein
MLDPMLDPSERHAQDLYRLLVAAVRPGAEFIVDGGVNRCRATRGERSCEVVCFETQEDSEHNAKYDIVFRRDDNSNLTAGRSSSESEIVAAVVCWMEGQAVGDLHQRFAFIGKEKRFFVSIEEGLLRYRPELVDETTREIQNLYAYSEGCELWFRTPTRSCCIRQARYLDAIKGPKCVFYWNDSSPLFTFSIRDLNHSAQVLKRWLCDNTMPSQLRVEFPWLTIGTLADCYEVGRPLEGEFLASWDFRERFYQEMPFSFSAEVLAFIADIRRAGYDRTLRAGTSHSSLVLSRSRHHPRGDQPRIVFGFREGRMDVYFDTQYISRSEDCLHPDETLAFPEIKFMPAVAELLRWLEAQEISQ